MYKFKINFIAYCIIFFCSAFILFGKSYAYQIKDVDVKLHGSVSEVYDDNVAFQKNDPKSDFVTNITPGLSAEYADELKSWSLTTNINQQIFAENTKFTNTSEDLNFDSKMELSKYDRITLKDAFAHTYEPASFEDAFTRINGRYGYYTNNLALEYQRDLNKQTLFNARYGHELGVFSREDLSDSYLNKAGFQLDHYLSSSRMILAAYDFSNRKFHPGDDATENSISFGFNDNLTKQLSFAAKAGADIINSFNGTDYTKPMFSLSLTDEINTATSASLAFTRDYRTNPYTQDIFNEWEVSAYFSRELLKNLTCVATGFYGRGKYVSLDIRDTLIGEGISFVYELKKNLKLNLAYDYSKVTSSDDTREYSKNKVTLGLKMDF